MGTAVTCPKCGLLQVASPACKSCGMPLGASGTPETPRRPAAAPTKGAPSGTGSRALKRVGIAAGILLWLGILGGGGVVLFSYLGPGLDADSQTYVDTTVPRFVRTWDAAELIAQASPELLQSASPDRIRALFAVFSKKLGALKEYRGAARGNKQLNFNFTQGRMVAFTYTASAVFENGPATLQVRIVARGGQWQILSFFVNAEALLQ